MKGQKAEIAQFFWGTAQETRSQNCTIPRGNYQLVVGVTGNQNYTTPRGNWQLASQSLAAKIVQFLEGTGSLLLAMKTTLRLGG